jgi:NAD(P)-dependent dehydrogenase (short-subunit alcohol dehydrogenase family)
MVVTGDFTNLGVVERRNTMTRDETMKTSDERLHHPPVDGDVQTQRAPRAMRVCIVGASGKLGKSMVQHALDRGYEVVGVCREESIGKLDAFKGRITIVGGATDDRAVIKRAVADCDAVLVVLVPRGIHGYSSGTAQAVLDYAPLGARLVFSCGWHITRDGQDVYSWRLKALVNVAGRLARLARVVDLDDQVEACRRVFVSDTRWTVVRGSDLEEGESQGLPVWSRHVGDAILKSNMTRRVDFALFMVAAIENDELVHEAPAIVGCRTPSALAHAATQNRMTADSRGRTTVQP